MAILKMSLSTSILIMVIVIIRTLTLNKLPKKTFLLLWSIALFRLLIPFSIQSQFSVYTIVDMLMNKEAVSDKSFMDPTVPDMRMTTSTIDPKLEKTVFLNVSPITVIWIVGLLTCILFFLFTHLRWRREYNTALPFNNEFVKDWKEKHLTRSRVEIRQSDKIAAPLTYGLCRPVILLPKNTDCTDETQLQYILAHEYVHIQHFDILIKVFLTTAVCVHWFNPLVWAMYVLANRDIELSCDETVIRKLGEKMKSAYAMTLIELEEKKARLTPLVNNFSKNAIEERIVSIMKMKKTSLGATILALVVIGITMAFATSAADASTKDNSSTNIFDHMMNDSASLSDLSESMMYITYDIDDKTYYSKDEGKTWNSMTKDEYNTKFQKDVEWYTYDEYKEWLDNEKIQLQSLIGNKGWNPTDGWYVWTQEKVDEVIKMYDQTLQDIKKGYKISKSVEGSSDIMLAMNPQDSELGAISSSYSVTIQLDNGNDKEFGPYNTKEELLNAIVPYCKKQVKAGNMTDKEVDKILNQFNNIK